MRWWGFHSLVFFNFHIIKERVYKDYGHLENRRALIVVPRTQKICSDGQFLFQLLLANILVALLSIELYLGEV